MNLSKKEKIRLKSKYGPWALVTGATSGIGKEIAQLLAGSGINLVLAARREKLLESISHSLKQTYPIDVQIFVGDLSDMKTVDYLIDVTKKVDMGLAVLNAGFGTSGSFINSSLNDEVNMVDLNVKSTLVQAHYFAKQFAGQRRGGIILVSSMLGFQGVPYSANYAATKAYVQSLAEALQVELEPSGVDVLAAAPGPVNTGFSERANLNMGRMLEPKDVGAPILKALGRKATVLPGWLTKLLTYSLATVPRAIKVKIMKRVMLGMTAHQQSK